ncbi:MAG: FKBP-type peptidyl-prolyl cis-trans isomerase [Pseudomonadota bacterium]
MRIALMAAAAMTAMAGAGCGKETTTEPTTADVENQESASDASAAAEAEAAADANAPSAAPELDLEKMAAENLAAAEKFLAENASKENVKVTESGLQYVVLEEGPENGFSPSPDDLVQVHYAGTFLDGREFDSSRGRGAAAQFKLGQVIPGWIEGVQLMSEGDRFRFFIPPALAYGENGAGPIEPNSALIFDVELIKVVDAKRNLEAAEKFLAENAKKDGVKTTESGLQYEIISEGPDDGAVPNDASKVKVHYVGTLVNGTEFDSSIARGVPAEFPVGGVIAGWTEGLQLMSTGDKFRFFIHPELAYGETPRPGGAIGPNDALIFEVELLDVQ